jgi:hypothetical protein
VTCPAGTSLFAGGCDGFTSVAIGQSGPGNNNAATTMTTWTCYTDRITTIGNTNLLQSHALCCQ